MTQTRALVQNKVMLRNLLYYYNRRFNHKSHPTFIDVIQKEIIADIESSQIFESVVMYNILLGILSLYPVPGPRFLRYNLINPCPMADTHLHGLYCYPN
jgi:hypothetical protein